MDDVEIEINNKMKMRNFVQDGDGWRRQLNMFL